MSPTDRPPPSRSTAPTVIPPPEACCPVCGRELVALPGGTPACEWCADRAESADRVALALACEARLVAAVQQLSPEEFRSYARGGHRDDVAAFRAAVPRLVVPSNDGDDEVPCG